MEPFGAVVVVLHSSAMPDTLNCGSDWKCLRFNSVPVGRQCERICIAGQCTLVVSCQWCFGFSGLLGISQQCPWRCLLPYSTVAPVVGHHMHSWIFIVFILSRSPCCCNTHSYRPRSALRFPVRSAPYTTCRCKAPTEQICSDIQ